MDEAAAVDSPSYGLQLVMLAADLTIKLTWLAFITPSTSTILVDNWTLSQNIPLIYNTNRHYLQYKSLDPYFGGFKYSWNEL